MTTMKTLTVLRTSGPLDAIIVEPLQTGISPYASQDWLDALTIQACKCYGKPDKDWMFINDRSLCGVYVRALTLDCYGETLTLDFA
jgi:hypothetical protein